MQQKLSKSIIRQINQDRKPTTILFTDIENSTRYWDKYGDIKGRLIVDQHNRIVFPAVKKYQGRIIKTIGDAVMASFETPAHAVKAAISIQQLLNNARNNNKDFDLKVRIGIHTGEAIIEDNDIFGDAVNIASRVENQAKGNEIALSGAAARYLNKQKYKLNKIGTFLPKGKKKEIALYTCLWEEYEDITKKVKLNTYLATQPKQKIELAVYLIFNIAALYFLFIYYARYLLSDSESFALIFLNPKLLLENPFASEFLLITLLLSSILIVKLKTVSLFTMSILKGGLYFCIGFLLFFHIEKALSLNIENKWNEALYESEHLFVEVLAENAKIYQNPDIKSKVLYRPYKGTLLLLNNVRKTSGINWNRVLIGKAQYGWIQRTIKNYNGDEIRVTLTNKFYFKYKDLYALILALAGFAWGYSNLKIRPT